MNIALGTIPFGTGVGLRETFAILDRFQDAGGTMLDTADNYPFWNEGCTGDESEEAIGAWLAARGNRDRIFIGTKGGARPSVPGDRTLDSAEGLSAAAVARAAEGSLRRLRTDYVDLYWSHIEDRSAPLHETLGALNTPASDDALDYVAAEPDVTLWAYNTLMAGAYTRADRPMPEIYDHPGTARRLAVLREVAGELGATPNQVVLAWLMADGHVPVVGVSTTAQLDEVVGAADVKLDAELRARLNAVA
ncbi:aldo/keto reductase [Nonomuraea sp. NPDC004702]